MTKTVDSYRFLHGIEKRVLQRWAGLPGETQIPWTPLATPLSKCTVSLVSSAGIALKIDHPFDPEIERRDPWFADPSYRVVPRTVRTGDIQVCHLHINPAFAEQVGSPAGAETSPLKSASRHRFLARNAFLSKISAHFRQPRES